MSQLHGTATQQRRVGTPARSLGAAMVLVLGFAAAAEAAPAALHYALTDLGTLEGDSVAYAINERGHVVGISRPSDHTSRAWVWKPAAGLAELHGLGGDQTFAYGINDVGQIVGGATIDFTVHALLWDASTTPTDLNPGPEHFSIAQAVNNAGRVVLQAQKPLEPGSSLMLWDADSGLVDYGRLNGADAQGWAINDSDEVALYWTAQGAPPHAMRWHPEDGLWFLSNDIPSAAGGVQIVLSGNSHAINEDGRVAGAYFVQGVPGGWRAFRWSPDPQRPRSQPQGNVLELATLGAESIAWGINDSGDVVGFSNPVISSRNEEDFRAVLWKWRIEMLPDGSEQPVIDLYDLNDLLVGPAAVGWTLLGAQDINNAGQIVGYGFDPQGQMRAFLLTPVPEPAAAALVLLLAGFAASTRRSRSSQAGS